MPVRDEVAETARLVEALVKVEQLFAVAAIGNDRLGSLLIQLLAQFGAIMVRRSPSPALLWKPTPYVTSLPFTTRLCRRADISVISLCEMRRSATGHSCASPPVSKIARRRPLASASAWILVFRPPRERPTACFCSLGGVDHLGVRTSTIAGKLSEQVFPYAATGPTHPFSARRRAVRLV
jgi:hypothetical protein